MAQGNANIVKEVLFLNLTIETWTTNHYVSTNYALVV